MKEMHKRIKIARKEAGLTQKTVAEKLGIDRVAITQWESSNEKYRTTPTFENLLAFSKMTAKSFQWLATGEERDEEVPTLDPETGVPDGQFWFMLDEEQYRALIIPKLKMQSGEPDIYPKFSFVLLKTSAEICLAIRTTDSGGNILFLDPVTKSAIHGSALFVLAHSVF